jgi:glycosyltransferase involved in cell wall biosynthesis
VLAKKSHQRILLFIHSMSGGGSERQMSYLANELCGDSHVRLVTLDRGDESAYSLDPAIERYGLNLTGGRGGWIHGLRDNFARIRGLREQVRSWKPDLVVSFCDSNNILALLAIGKNVPAIISERSDPRRQKLGRLWEALRRYAYPKCTRCVVQTREVGDYMTQSGLVPLDRISIIPSAVKVPSTAPISLESKASGLPPYRLVYVGRLSREKNVASLIEAWNMIPAFHGLWKLVILGDGPERAKLQQLAAKHELDSSIEWRLWCDDVWRELRLASAYCLVSHYEGFSQSMLEAMSMGLPVAVTDCSPSVRETIVHERNGLLIPMPATPASIAATLTQLLSDASLRIKLGKQAALKASEFDWQAIAPRWREVCQLGNSMQ